ncbi:MAG: hypothetical protein IPI49_29600 [Myxococcales bacterium]|nr:hypothetical protein [Myxococcales bacterium]
MQHLGCMTITTTSSVLPPSVTRSRTSRGGRPAKSVLLAVKITEAPSTLATEDL